MSQVRRLSGKSESANRLAGDVGIAADQKAQAPVGGFGDANAWRGDDLAGGIAVVVKLKRGGG